MDGGGVTLVVPAPQQTAQDVFKIIRKEVELPTPPHLHLGPSSTSGGGLTASPSSTGGKGTSSSSNIGNRMPTNNSLTARDIERDRGRPLTKYERNMMIFNWLQTLEESPYDLTT